MALVLNKVLYCIVVLEKKNYEVGRLCSYFPTCDPRCGAFDPPGHDMNKLDRCSYMEMLTT